MKSIVFYGTVRWRQWMGWNSVASCDVGTFFFVLEFVIVWKCVSDDDDDGDYIFVWFDSSSTSHVSVAPERNAKMKKTEKKSRKRTNKRRVWPEYGHNNHTQKKLPKVLSKANVFIRSHQVVLLGFVRSFVGWLAGLLCLSWYDNYVMNGPYIHRSVQSTFWLLRASEWMKCKNTSFCLRHTHLQFLFFCLFVCFCSSIFGHNQMTSSSGHNRMQKWEHATKTKWRWHTTCNVRMHNT